MLSQDFPYYHPARLTFTLDGQPIQVVTRPGLPAWDQLPATTHLLAGAARLPPQARVLLLGCGSGALAVALCRQLPQGELWLADSSHLALQLSQQTLQHNQLPNYRIHDMPDFPAQADASLDAVFIQLPKGRQLIRRWLLQSRQLLKPGGSLFLAGANRAGIQSAIQDMQSLFGQTSVLAYRKGSRVAMCLQSAQPPLLPDWSSEPGISPGTWLEFPLPFRQHLFHIRSLPGVFSSAHLDEGTALLLDHLSVPPGARLLDLGCGYGILGLAASYLGAASVDMLDDNLLAVACARENILHNHALNTTAFPSDLYEAVAGQSYDLIVSNPPFHAGHAVDYQVANTLIQQASRLLLPGGRLLIVANKFIRYNRLMQQGFQNVLTLAETGKYHILSSQKAGV